MSCRLPCAAADSRRLASIFNLTGRLAPRYSRYSHLDQVPCESCGISRFSRRRRFLALPSLSSPLSPPLMRVSSLGFHIWLDGRHRGARVPRTDIKHHTNRAVFRDFLGDEDFSQRRRLLASLVAPVAAADASCLAWISDLAGRQAPRRPSSTDRHQAPCKSRGISRFSQRRRFFSAATIFGLAVPLVAPIAAVDARYLA